MSTGAKIFKGIFWSIVKNLVHAIYGFISVPLLINIYGKEHFGLISLALSVNMYLQLMDMGFNNTNIRYFSKWLVEKQHEKVHQLFQSSLFVYGTIGVVNGLALVVLSVFSQSLFHLNVQSAAILRNLLLILAAVAIANWISGTFDQLIKSTENVSWVEMRAVIPKILQTFVLLTTIYFKLSIEAYFLLTVISTISILPLSVVKIKNLMPEISFRPQYYHDIFKQVLPYAFGVFGLAIFQFSAQNLRPIILGMQSGVSSVAEYRVIDTLTSLIVLFTGSFFSVFLPSASKVRSIGDADATDALVYRGTKYLSTFLSFFVFSMILVSQNLISLYVGEGYLYLNIWLTIWLATLLGTHNSIVSSVVFADNKLRPLILMSGISSCMSIAIAWVLSKLYGVGGVVIGYSTYMVMQTIFNYLYYYPVVMKLNSRKLFLNFVGPALTFLLILGGTKLFFVLFQSRGHWVDLIMKEVTFLAISAFAVYRLVLDSEDISYIKRIVLTCSERLVSSPTCEKANS